MMSLNVKSQFFLIKECHELLKKGAELNGEAAICVVSSVASITPNFNLGVYAMTKAALDNMVISLS